MPVRRPPGLPTVVVVNGTTGLDIAAALGNPVGPIAYNVIVATGVALGNIASSVTLDASGLNSSSLGFYIVDGSLLGGGGNAWVGGTDLVDAVGGGPGGGGGAGFPAGTAGGAGSGGAGAGVAGDDTSISGLSPVGGAAGGGYAEHGLHDIWDTGVYGVAPPSVATAPNGGDVILTNHALTITIGSVGRIWGGGGPGIPGHFIFATFFIASNPGEAGMPPGVDQTFPNQVAGFLPTVINGGLGGFAVRLTGGAPAPTFLGPNTGADFIKGTVG